MSEEKQPVGQLLPEQVENRIKTELEQFNELAPEPKPIEGGEVAKRNIENTIGEVVKFCTNFKISDSLEGAKELALAKKVLTKVVGYRTGLDKKRIALKAPYLKIGKSIDDEAKRLTALLAPGEKAISDTIANAENAAAKKKQDRAIERKKKLIALGFAFDGQLYVLGREMILPSKLEESTDEEFAVILESGTTESERLIEEHAKQQEQLQQLQNLQDQQAETTNESVNTETTSYSASTVKTGEPKNLRWFTDRIGKKVMAHSQDHFNGLMIVKDNSHAVKLAHFYQSSQGYYFEDAPEQETTVATTEATSQTTVKIKGYKEGYEQAIEDALKVLADPEGMTRRTIIERIGKLIDNVKGIVY